MSSSNLQQDASSYATAESLGSEEERVVSFNRKSSGVRKGGAAGRVQSQELPKTID